MKLIVIATTLLALSACAEFPAGTQVAPGFPKDNFELSHNTVPASQEATTPAQLGR
jgi:hypothetical protein